MCLNIQHDAKECIATKDITCYKVIQAIGQRRKAYLTFYMSKRIKFDVIYRSVIKIKLNLLTGCNQVHEGLHSFKTKTDLFDRFMKRKGFISLHVAKCTIPKGAKYYMGTFNGSRGYASNRIRYDEIVYSWK